MPNGQINLITSDSNDKELRPAFRLKYARCDIHRFSGYSSGW